MRRQRFSSLAAAASLALALTLSSAAFAQTPDDFVKTGQQNLTNLLRQPPSAAREAQIASEFDKLIDYNEVAKRCFKEDWAKLTPQQQTEVTDLIHKLVAKNYKKNLNRTLQYTVTYTGAGQQGTDTRVRTEAKSNTNARETVQVDYMVAGSGAGPFKIVDIVTEGSSLTSSYFNQFHKMMNTSGQGYPYIVQKINEKLAKPD